MPDRSFSITMAANTNYQNLYTAMLAVTGAVPTDGILPDRVKSIGIQADPTNAAASTVTVGDANYANTNGLVLSVGAIFADGGGNLNNVCLRDYWIKGSAGSLKYNVRIGY